MDMFLNEMSVLQDTHEIQSSYNTGIIFDPEMSLTFLTSYSTALRAG